MTLAAIPGAPTAGPVSDSTVTNGNQIRVTYSAVADNGGSVILSYELQMGSDYLNFFETVQGSNPQVLALSFTVTRNVVKGKIYSFRYRAVNGVGAGPWSPISEVTAATVPMRPPQPTYVASTSTSITLAFLPTQDNGGSEITSYYLMRDAGNLASDINILVPGYDGISSSYTVTGLTPGDNYRFQYYAVNAFGSSMPSAATTVAASSLPQAPSAP